MLYVQQGGQMAKIITDITNLVFGGKFVGPPYPIGFENGSLQQLNPVPLRSLFTTEENGYVFKMPVRLRKAKPNSETYEEFILPNEPVISIYGSKDVTTTSIQRGNKRGTVKEERNLEDYEIRIEGRCINTQNEDDYPEEQVRGLRKFFEMPGPVLVDNVILNIMGITQISLIGGIRLTRSTGIPINQQPYVIAAVSDEDFELEIE